MTPAIPPCTVHRVLAAAAAIALSTGCAAGAGDEEPGQGSGVSADWTAAGEVPGYEPDPLFFSVLPNRWVSGQVGGLAVDSNDNIWVFHRPATIPDGEKAAALDPPEAECCFPAPPVLHFDAGGEFVRGWGGPGEGYEWFSNEHGIFVDYEGNVWLSGSASSDNHILKFTGEGEFLMQIGRAGMGAGSNDTLNVGDRPGSSSTSRRTNSSSRTATGTVASSSSMRRLGPTGGIGAPTGAGPTTASSSPRGPSTSS